MTTASSRDYFSTNSGDYRRYRPSYPETLFTYLASIAPSPRVAWDCATGSGQAATGLARHFSTLIATDASARQIQSAQPASNIRYLIAKAEAAPIRDHAVDLITLAQALHWLDTQAFFAEAGRVLRARGVLAVWSYGLLTLAPGLDEVIGHFYREVIGGYWPAQRRLVEEGYRGIAFPFDRMPAPAFEMSVDWCLEELLGYIGTWSAVSLYREDRGADPMDILAGGLLDHWGEPTRRRRVVWPLSLIVGRADRGG